MKTFILPLFYSIFIIGESISLMFESLSIFVPILLTVAYFTLAERKVMASLQRRVGPNMNGPWGLLQPVCDGIQLLFAEIIIPSRANAYLFLWAPVSMFTLSFTLFLFIPFSYQTVFVESKYSLLLVFTVSSLNVYSVLVAGWASNSRYALLGAARAMAQMLSYELVLSTLILTIYLVTGTLRLADYVAIQDQSGIWLIFPFLPIAVIFFIAILAETNRTPFDLTTTESEIVAGYHVEYSSMLFAFIFISEYCSILAMATIYAIIFLGGWLPPFLFPRFLPPAFYLTCKVMLVCFVFILVRALLPRYRFDQLLGLGWRTLFPLTFGFFLFYLGVMWATASLPYTSTHFLLVPDLFTDHEYVKSDLILSTPKLWPVLDARIAYYDQMHAEDALMNVDAQAEAYEAGARALRTARLASLEESSQAVEA
jgi:NADH-quinone oxidoreductase subunit H